MTFSNHLTPITILIDELDKTRQRYEESLSELNNQEGTFYVIDAVNYLHSKLWNNTLLEDRPVGGSLKALVGKVSGTYSLRDGVKTEDVIKTIKNYR